MVIHRVLARMAKDVLNFALELLILKPINWYKNAKKRVQLDKTIRAQSCPNEWEINVGDLVVLATGPFTATSVRTIEEIGVESIRINSVFSYDSHDSKNWWKKTEFFKTFKPFDLGDIFTVDYPKPNIANPDAVVNSANIADVSKATAFMGQDYPQILKDVMSVPKPKREIEATPPRPEGWGKKPVPKSYEERVAIIERRDMQERLRTLEFTQKYHHLQVAEQDKRKAEIESLKKRIAESESESESQYRARKAREAADAEIKLKTKIQLQLDAEDGPLDAEDTNGDQNEQLS